MLTSGVAHRLDDCERTEDVHVDLDVSFECFGLSQNTLIGLKNSGFQKPSPIQYKSIPLGRCGYDLIVEAKSGTGKTAVFGIIALEMLTYGGALQVLILAPTREIASQIGQVLKQIGAAYEDLNVEIVMGGTDFSNDIKKLKSKKVQILVGSPGRVCQLIKKNVISTKSIRLMVLDEADRLMDESFQKDINYIYSHLPKQKQFIAVSATYSDELRTFLHRYMHNPSHIKPYATNVLIGVSQHFALVPTHENEVRQNEVKFDKAVELLSTIPFNQSLLFCKYRSRARYVRNALMQNGWPAEYLAGCQKQSERLDSLEKLQTFSCRILVTTDLAARGIDASRVDLVINVDPPDNWDTYLHRIGRAGRYGSKAQAITILSEKEKVHFDDVLKPLGENLLKLFNVDETQMKKYVSEVKPENVYSKTTLEDIKQSKPFVEESVPAQMTVSLYKYITSEFGTEIEVSNDKYDKNPEQFRKKILESLRNKKENSTSATEESYYSKIMYNNRSNVEPGSFNKVLESFENKENTSISANKEIGHKGNDCSKVMYNNEENVEPALFSEVLENKKETSISTNKEISVGKNVNLKIKKNHRKIEGLKPFGEVPGSYEKCMNGYDNKDESISFSEEQANLYDSLTSKQDKVKVNSYYRAGLSKSNRSKSKDFSIYSDRQSFPENTKPANKSTSVKYVEYNSEQPDTSDSPDSLEDAFYHHIVTREHSDQYDSYVVWRQNLRYITKQIEYKVYMKTLMEYYPTLD